MFSKYRHYITSDGLSGVKVRAWHPSWFIPMWKIKIDYWIGICQRYKSYQKSLSDIYNILNFKNRNTTDVIRLKECYKIIENIDCSFECEYTEPYGFVPEAGCPIHD